jgi:hypothetical protein
MEGHEEETEEEQEERLRVEEALSKSTLEALQEFLRENASAATNEWKEDFSLSQFWYSDETARLLATEVCWSMSCDCELFKTFSCDTAAAPGSWRKDRVAERTKGDDGAPGVSHLLLESRVSDSRWSRQAVAPQYKDIVIFEFDRRFGELYPEHFQLFDFNHVELLPNHFYNTFDVLLIDPPYLVRTHLLVLCSPAATQSSVNHVGVLQNEETLTQYTAAVRRLARQADTPVLAVTGTLAECSCSCPPHIMLCRHHTARVIVRPAETAALRSLSHLQE